MWVKICANTNVEDAQRATDLGADAVGFVFAPSARQVTPEETGAITRGLVGTVERIGVFPDWDFNAVRFAVRAAGLSGVQLHGFYGRELPRRLRTEFGDEITIAQTLHWSTLTSLKGGRQMSSVLLDQMREISTEGDVDRVLVDSQVGAALGGTGQAFDWESAEALFRRADGIRMIVAGGLRPENVEQAIGRLQPWGVDVASGVEAVPGRKDLERLRAFIAKARGVAPD